MTSDDFSALGRKYRMLSALRTRRDGPAEAEPTTRQELRALAAEFPGCLRELDTLGKDELARRALACGAAAADKASREPWMAWIADYHALMREALALRRARGRPVRRAVSRGEGGFAAQVLAPPSGRQNVVVLRTLAARHGVPAATIAQALFPLRRPSPYRL